MGQLVVAAAGAIVGSTFGMPGLGWVVGSAIGGALFNQTPSLPDQHVEGARLADLKVTGTDYGQCIPWVQGSPRISPQIWWASDKRQIANTTYSTTSGGGGKGGDDPPQQTTSSTTYTYDVDLLLGLTDNEIDGISRIWENGKLIYNVRADADAETIAASLASPRWSRITVYTGAADQLPDPTYEAAVGADNAVAYRGRSYVFIESLHLGQGGQIPNLTFEMRVDEAVVDVVPWAEVELPYTGLSRAAYGNNTFVAINATQCAISSDGLTWEPRGVFGAGTPVGQVFFCGGRFFVTPSGAGDTGYTSTDGINWTAITFPTAGMNWTGIDYGNGIYFAISFGFTHAASSTDGITWTARSLPNLVGANSWESLAFGDDWFVIINRSSDNAYRTQDGITYSTAALGASGVTDWFNVCFGDGVFVVTQPDTNKIARSTDAGATWATVTAPIIDEFFYMAFGGGYFVAQANPSERSLISTDGGLTWDDSYDLPSVGSSNWGNVTYGNGKFFVGSAYDSGAIFTLVFSGPSLAATVSELCLRAGLTADQFDVTGLSTITKPVRGLAVSQVAPVRSTLEMLMSAFFFQATVSDKIYFTPRGSASVVTIPYADLGAGENESTEPLALKQRTDIELPSQVAVTYANVDNDHQTDTQLSDRLVTAVTDTVNTVQIALSLTPAEAKGIADTIALDQQVALISTGINVLGDYARLEPTDVVVATGADGSTFRLRLVQRTDAYPLLQFAAVLDDSSVLIDEGITSADYTPSTTVAAPVETLIELMDIPILRDTDNAAGFYVAAKGADTPWSGANVYGSADDVTYAYGVTVGESAVFGDCTTTLGDWTGPRVFDETNSVTVDVGAGTLSSVTRDQILNDQAANALLVGSEILQFRTATLQGAGIYKLTGLLRGCRGTEWAMVAHVADERCVLLQTAGIRRMSTLTANLGLSRYYKGVTLGGSVSAVDGEAFTDNGVALKPFSPVDLRASRDGSDNITFTWQRRTRLGVRMTGTLGISVPLGEDSESYSLDVYSDGTFTTVLRTLTASSPTVDYSAALQTADGLTPGDPVYVRVYQLSALVNRGYPLEQAA